MNRRIQSSSLQAPCFLFHKQAAKEMAIVALTHSSASSRRNNVELAKVGDACGRAAAVKAVFKREDLSSGQDYDRYALSRFATKNLAPIARRIGLAELQRVGRGTPLVSDEMCARVLLALLGVLELTGGNNAVLRAITDLGILDLPPFRAQMDVEELEQTGSRPEPDTIQAPTHW
ncbi:hypothetical protein JCM10908_001229 [Rhodotorula pacifica]|uniref:uncharacterized protein n=1 Tax=Rhodotorula pacifica TaxID=1495444 RepID=UPI003170754C